MPSNGCWGKFFSCCQKTGVVFNEVVVVLEGLVNQTELFINVLIAAGVINSDDENVVQALRVLSTMNGSLKVADKVAQRLKKYVPEDLAQVPDLNGDGKIDGKDLAMLLKDGQATLTDLIKEGFVTPENAQAWQNVFIQLISALDNQSSGLKKVTANSFAEAKATIGPAQLKAISDRLNNRPANLLYVNENFPKRADLVAEIQTLKSDNARVNESNRRLNSKFATMDMTSDAAVQRSLQRYTFQLVPTATSRDVNENRAKQTLHFGSK